MEWFSCMQKLPQDGEKVLLIWEDWDLNFANLVGKRGRKETYIGTYEAVFKGKGRYKEIVWTNIKKLSGKCIYRYVPTELSDVRYKFHWARLT